VRTAPPQHGQHTDQVLHSVGYTPDEIAHLRQQEVI
jgi:crotonobetainyl-CoA:carnitine CoA-transferase CaiB-like acyl-CoA transferase